jgi:glycosyltransferase involved in cell wall biosynthesis
MRRNIDVLERLHPGYGELVTTWAERDPLAPARRRLDEARWGNAASTLLITHASGGGVERSVQARAAQLTGRTIILRPVPVPGDTDGAHLPGLCRVEDATQPSAFPNLVYHLPNEMPGLLKLLRRSRVVAVEMHHRLGHAPEIADIAGHLGLKADIVLHDCSAFCPRVTLLGPAGRYCGEPTEIATCNACVAQVGARNGEAISVAALRQRSAAEFAAARTVSVPSGDMAKRMRRHFAGLTPQIAPPENDAMLPAPPPTRRDSGPLIVAVIGALGVDKGLDVLLACAQDAALRDLALRFRLVGHSENDAALFATGRVFVTGRFGEAEAESLLRSQSAHLAFLPSVVPESWGYTLSLAWRAGLRAVVFDLGAQGERVRRTGWGNALPLGLPADSINNSLLDCANH